MITPAKVFAMVLLFLLLSGGPGSALQDKDFKEAIPGKKLIVGVTNDPPYVFKEPDGQWSGLNVDIWKAISQDLLLQYEFREMKFQGLLEALKKSEIDLSIEAFFVLAERQKFMDYSYPFGTTRLAVATVPEKMSHPWLTAIKIFFSWGMLKIIIGLCSVLVVLGLIFWLIERKTNPDHFGGRFVEGVGSGIYWVGSTLASGVCFGIALKSLPARILGLIWMLTCALALSAMIASLTASLTAYRSQGQLVSNEELQHMHLACIKGSAESQALKHLGGKPKQYEDEASALDAVMKRKVDGFFYDEITLRYYQYNSYRDRISVYPTASKRYAFGFGLPKESPIRKKIDFAILNLMEKPDWQFMLKKYGLRENFESEQAPDVRVGRK